MLVSARFVDRSPGEVVATLLDESQYLCSERTMYRVLAFHYYNGAIDGIWGESSQAASEVARKAYGGTDGGFMKACEGRGWTPPE